MPFTTTILLIILSYTWYIEPRVPRGFVTVPIGLIAVLGIWHSARTGEWGFQRRAFVPALRAAALITVFAGIAILIAGAVLGTLHDRRDFLGSLGPLVVWGGAQQWILQTVVLREAQRVAAGGWGILIAVALFAIVHLPNPFLTSVTFAGGLAWCSIYARHPNILPLALSHGLGTLAVQYAFNSAITGRLRIGLSYLRLGM